MSLFEINFVHDDSVSFSEKESEFLKENIESYTLRKSSLEITFYIDALKSITRICEMMNAMTNISIVLHDKHSMINRTISLNMNKNCVSDFEFFQHYGSQDQVKLKIAMGYYNMQEKVC